MINVRALANSVTGSVNPNTLVTIRVSKGYTIGAGRKQIPAYEDTQGYAQVQALDHGDLMKIENLNLQGVIRSIYLTGPLHGIIRKEGVGGDLVLIENQTWLVSKVLETWPSWTKAVITLQVD